jgi:hypothetical protein
MPSYWPFAPLGPSYAVSQPNCLSSRDQLQPAFDFHDSCLDMEDLKRGGLILCVLEGSSQPLQSCFVDTSSPYSRIGRTHPKVQQLSDSRPRHPFEASAQSSGLCEFPLRSRFFASMCNLNFIPQSRRIPTILKPVSAVPHSPQGRQLAWHPRLAWHLQLDECQFVLQGGYLCNAPLPSPHR